MITKNPRPDLFTSRHCPCKLCGNTTLNVVSKICDRCGAGVIADCPRCGCGPCEGCLTNAQTEGMDSTMGALDAAEKEQ